MEDCSNTRCSRFRLIRVDKDGTPNPSGKHLKLRLVLVDGGNTFVEGGIREVDTEYIVLPAGEPPTVRIEERDGVDVFIFGLPEGGGTSQPTNISSPNETIDVGGSGFNRTVEIKFTKNTKNIFGYKPAKINAFENCGKLFSLIFGN